MTYWRFSYSSRFSFPQPSTLLYRITLGKESCQISLRRLPNLWHFPRELNKLWNSHEDVGNAAGETDGDRLVSESAFHALQALQLPWCEVVEWRGKKLFWWGSWNSAEETDGRITVTSRGVSYQVFSLFVICSELIIMWLIASFWMKEHYCSKR